VHVRELVDKASFSPQALKVIYQAFDDAWSEIAADYDPRSEAEAVRTHLAKALLSVASEASVDSGAIKRLALELMAAQKSWPKPLG